ncbi:hypothetical protein GOODEAATRI_023913 [Goodea atripinnis]|uniref:Uncharacterized protein n=1 Tax=Goodea atripinnis TaxID=208336 RepID=A0ABV0N3W4_9TELE
MNSDALLSPDRVRGIIILHPGCRKGNFLAVILEYSQQTSQTDQSQNRLPRRSARLFRDYPEQDPASRKGGGRLWKTAAVYGLRKGINKETSLEDLCCFFEDLLLSRPLHKERLDWDQVPSNLIPASLFHLLVCSRTVGMWSNESLTPIPRHRFSDLPVHRCICSVCSSFENSLNPFSHKPPHHAGNILLLHFSITSCSGFRESLCFLWKLPTGLQRCVFWRASGMELLSVSQPWRAESFDCNLEPCGSPMSFHREAQFGSSAQIFTHTEKRLVEKKPSLYCSRGVGAVHGAAGICIGPYSRCCQKDNSPHGNDDAENKWLDGFVSK